MEARKFERLKQKIENNTLDRLVFEGDEQLSNTQTLLLARSIRKNTSIGELSFRGAQTSPAIISLILPAFRKSTKLQRVTIKSQQLTPEKPAAITAIKDLLRSNRFVTELDMSDCNIGDKILIMLSPMLEENRAIIKLVLRNNALTQASSAEFFGALSRNKFITDLDLSSNRFGVAIADIVSMLANNRRIKVLNLYDNSLSVVDMFSLAQIYRGSFPLQLSALYLAHNNLGDAGIRIFTGMMANQHDFKTISVASNHITATGLRWLADWLYSSPSLEYFACANNVVGDEGAFALADLIRSCLALKIVLAYGCGFGSRGVTEIVKALSLSESVIYLDLCGADFDEETVTELACH